MSDLRLRWSLVIIVLLAFALRMFRIDLQELRGDEAFSWTYVTEEPGPAAIVDRIVREGESHPPIHYWVLQAWVRVFGDSEFALRNLSAFLSLLLVPLMAQFARMLVGRPAPVLLGVALLTALHPFQVWLAQDAKNMYPLAMVAGLLGALTLPGLLRGKRRNWIVYVVSGAFALYSHYYAVFGLMAHAVYVAVARTDRAGWLRWGKALLTIILMLTPWLLLIVPSFLATGEFDATRAFPLSEYLTEIISDAALGPSLADGAALFGAGVALVIIVAGAVGLWRRQRAVAVWLIVWPLITLAGIYAILQVRSIFNTFYFILAFPAVYLLFTMGLVAIARRRVLLALVVSGVVVGFASGLSNYYFDPDWSRSRGWREAAAFLSVEATPRDVLIANFPDPAIDYYLRGVELPVVLLPERADFDAGEVRAQVDALGDAYERVWHVPARVAQWDANSFVEAQLVDRYINVADVQFDQVRLRQFVADTRFLSQYRALNAEFADGITLLGSYVTVNGDPNDAQADAGDWLRVTLLWSASEPLGMDYKVFVHATNVAGVVVDQHDSAPHNGFAPTSGWMRGEVIFDVHEFQIKPERAPDAITLQIGMYDQLTGDRLPVLAGGDNVRIWP